MKLEIGQYIDMILTEYPERGKVVKIEPPFVYVRTSYGLLRFDDYGYECNPDGTLAEGHYEPQFQLPFRPRLSLRGGED